MNKKLFIVLFLVVSLFFANGCTPQDTSSCNDDSIKPCDGNKLCEEGEYGLSDDCPDCDDYKLYTSDSYDFEKQECVFEQLGDEDVYQLCVEEGNQYSTSKCIYNNAVSMNAAKLCNKMLAGYKDTDTNEESISKGKCIFEIFLKTKDIDLFSELKKEQDSGSSVHQWIAKEAIINQDYPLCEYVKYLNSPFNSDENVVQCFFAVYRNSNVYDSTDRCKGVSSNYMDLCMDPESCDCLYYVGVAAKYRDGVN